MQHRVQASWYIRTAHLSTVQIKAGGCLSDHKLNIYNCCCVCRGEKLYVTKDKRQSQSWRRCICWGCGFVLLSVAILIAVLAGSEYTAVIEQCYWAEMSEWGMEAWVWSTGWMTLTLTLTLALAHTRIQRKAFPVPQYPPQFACGLSWDWTLASSWTGWQSVAWLLKQAIRLQILLRDWFMNEYMQWKIVFKCEAFFLSIQKAQVSKSHPVPR